MQHCEWCGEDVESVKAHALCAEALRDDEEVTALLVLVPAVA